MVGENNSLYFFSFWWGCSFVGICVGKVFCNGEHKQSHKGKVPSYENIPSRHFNSSILLLSDCYSGDESIFVYIYTFTFFSAPRHCITQRQAKPIEAFAFGITLSHPHYSTPDRPSPLPYRRKMVVKLRLARFGVRHAPVYNIVVAHARYVSKASYYYPPTNSVN